MGGVCWERGGGEWGLNSPKINYDVIMHAHFLYFLINNQKIEKKIYTMYIQAI